MREHTFAETQTEDLDAGWASSGLHETKLHALRTKGEAYDPRPLWQRLDEEEDLLLIKQRKFKRLMRQAILVALAITTFLWVISG